MIAVTTTPSVQGTTPVPPRPEPTAEILDAASKPLFRGEYANTQRHEWRDGLPFFGTKVSSTRQVAFSNEFNVLHVGDSPMVRYAATSLDDAIRSARDLAFDWSDPALGGRIYDSVGVAVLQAADGAFFTALIGSGDRQTSGSELGYRSDRFDGNIRGNPKRATDARVTSPWTAPVDADGTPVDTPAPKDTHKIKLSELQYAPPTIVPYSSTLKAIVDVTNVYTVDQPVEG